MANEPIDRRARDGNGDRAVMIDTVGGHAEQREVSTCRCAPISGLNTSTETSQLS